MANKYKLASLLLLLAHTNYAFCDWLAFSLTNRPSESFLEATINQCQTALENDYPDVPTYCAIYHLNDTKIARYRWTDPNSSPCNPGSAWTQASHSCTNQGTNCANAIASNGGNGSFTISSNGTTNCTVGTPGQCQTTIGGGACYQTPNNGGCNSGYNYGTINGTPTCVASSGGNTIGTSNPSSWGSSTAPSSVIGTTNNTTNTTTTSGGSQTTTTTSTTTSTPTTNTIPDENAPGLYTCEDGQLASDIASCDTAVVCSSSYYLDYGACVPLPTNSTLEEEQETTTTTTVVDNQTGETTTTTSTGTQVISSPSSSQSGGEILVEVELGDGPCDPTSEDYLSCISVDAQPLPEHTVNQDDYVSGLQAFYTRLENVPLVHGFQVFTNLVPDDPGSCSPYTIDLSGTIINQVASSNIFCDLAESMRLPLSGLMIIVYLIVAFRVFASA